MDWAGRGCNLLVDGDAGLRSDVVECRKCGPGVGEHVSCEEDGGASGEELRGVHGCFGVDD